MYDRSETVSSSQNLRRLAEEGSQVLVAAARCGIDDHLSMKCFCLGGIA
jgi:hypothetical protein